METPVPERPARPFGLIETTIIVIVIGITALFAIPRYEAHAELPVVEQAIRFGEWVNSHQSALHRKGLEYSEHIDQFQATQTSVRMVPEDFSLESLLVDGRESWELTLVRREGGSAFGAYTVVWDDKGYSRSKSTVPLALLPDDLLKQLPD